MIRLTQPSEAHVRAFIASQQPLPFSYAEVGASRDGAPPGYPVNHYRLRLGSGREVFERAVEALQRWRMFDLPWTVLYWPAAPIEPGSVVAIAAHHYGLWSLNACRIVYTIDERGAVERRGFAYGTLPGHVEQGEERFTIEWQRHDNAVWYEIFAFARAKHLLPRIAYPLARLVQWRFAVDSAHAMLLAAAQDTVSET
ncbi:MAG: DUF1990 domain-containing protein [Herpetosiphonaceae bacterium]|nr:MAG: DUF1990 domain-containing protein [Herpetosiphonaceae bacterium]